MDKDLHGSIHRAIGDAEEAMWHPAAFQTDLQDNVPKKPTFEDRAWTGAFSHEESQEVERIWTFV